MSHKSPVKVVVFVKDNQRVKKGNEIKRLAILKLIANEFIEKASLSMKRCFIATEPFLDSVGIQEVIRERWLGIFPYYKIPSFLRFSFEYNNPNTQILNCLQGVSYAYYYPELQKQILKILVPIAERNGINKIVFHSDDISFMSSTSRLTNPVRKKYNLQEAQ